MIIPIILWIILIIPIHIADGLFWIIPILLLLLFGIFFDYSIWIILIIPF